MTPNDFGEREVRAAWSRAVDELSPRLDERMAGRFDPVARPARRAALWWPAPWARPAFAAAGVVIALGLGFFLGTLQQGDGPLSTQGAAPDLVRQDDDPGAVALYALLDDVQLQRFQRSVAAAAPMAAGEPMDDAAQPMESEPESAVSSSLTLQPQASAVAEAAKLGGDAWQGWAASVAIVQQDLITAIDESVVRMKADGAWETIARALQRPIGVAVDAFGRVFVTEHLADGSLIALELNGERTTIRGGLNYPAGISFAPDRSLYLAEQGRGRVLRFLPLEGRILPESPFEVFATGFGGQFEADVSADPARRGGPFSLAVTPANQLLVSDRREGKTAIYRFELSLEPNWWESLFRSR